MRRDVAFFPSIEKHEANPYWRILGSALNDLGVTVRPSGDLLFGKRWLWANRSKIDIIHFHYVQQFYAYEGTNARFRWVLRFASNLLLARLLGYITVFTLHNATPTYPLEPRWVDHLGHLAAVHLTDSVIVHCEVARQLLKDEFGRHKHVHIVSHPHYMDQYKNTVTRAAARTSLGIAPRNLVFAFIGGIRPNKGIDPLIAAFAQLEGTHLSLIITGKPWPPDTYIDHLEQSVAQDPRMMFHKGFVSDEELQIYFNAADAVVLPFERILTSGSAILAMGFGCPVVAPAIGCLPELIGEDAGILYDSSDASALLDALKHCQDYRGALSAMGEQARRRVSRFTPRLMAEQTLAAYGASS